MFSGLIPFKKQSSRNTFLISSLTFGSFVSIYKNGQIRFFHASEQAFIRRIRIHAGSSFDKFFKRHGCLQGEIAPGFELFFPLKLFLTGESALTTGQGLVILIYILSVFSKRSILTDPFRSVKNNILPYRLLRAL